MRFEFLATLEEDWQPVSKAALIGWFVFYGVFLLHALTARGDLLIDLVFLPIHEGGHLLFGWFGQWPGVLGGTALQLGVPLALTVYFVFQRHIPGTAFCAFFFFEQFLKTATSMADSRRQELQYVTVGEGDAIHDWFFVFSNLGLLEYDTLIGGVVQVLGWLGMLATLGWFVKRSRTRQAHIHP